MTVPSHTVAPARISPGEVSGAFLYGLTQAFYNLAIQPEGDGEFRQSTLDPEKWYPYDFLISTVDKINRAFPSSSDIFFRAGMYFLDFWYTHGPGKTMIFSGVDWLNANNDSGGYNSVVRGGSPCEIGWCRLLSLDLEAGHASYENVMPLRADFVKGIFYRGCMLFNDIDFVDVTADHEPHTENPIFNKFILKLKFKLRPPLVASDIAQRLDEAEFGNDLCFSPDETHSLLWQYKNARKEQRMTAAYFNEVNAALASTVERVQLMQENLVRSEKMAALGGLVAGIAHEINTPVGLSLTGATHFKHMLARLGERFRAGELEEADFERFLADANELARSVTVSLEKAANLVRSFKLVAVDQTLDDLRSFEPAPYIRDILLTHHQALHAAKVTTTLECDETLKVESHAGAWSQILSNLINNSLIHGFAGVSHARSIQIVVRAVGDNVGLLYTDNGRGMAPEVAEHVFDPFFTTNRQGGGTGLGMHVVYNLVTQKLKGQIALETQPGQGVQFALTLPIHGARAEAPAFGLDTD